VLDTLVLLFGCLEAGKTFLPLNPRDSYSKIGPLLRRADTGLVILGRSAKFESKEGERVEDEDMWQMIAAHWQDHGDASIEKPNFSAPWFMVMTSGSTGEPKAVVHSFEAAYYSALGSNQFYGLGEGDTTLLTLPLFHVGGLMMAIRSILGGGVLAITEELDADALENYRPSTLSLVPTQLIRMIDDPKVCGLLARTKALLLGGAPLPAELVRKARARRVPLSLTYGLSESCAQVAATLPRATDQGAKVLPYREVEIKDGLVRIRGKTLFLGYFTPEGLTRPFDSLGWFETSDLGTWEDDGLNVLGRADDVFICGGENISPQEIERGFYEFEDFSGLAHCFPLDDQTWGKVPALVICSSEEPDAVKLADFFARRFSGIKRPRSVFWTPSWEGKLVVRKMGQLKGLKRLI
jgi:O-succinylbenzoic acid--CoA ligase